ncbi:ROK family transcriptional regulator [Dactylosporangium sp. NPDC005555]|uniref:ROK family transcriptional regulator n=1 Tax=Dactylosporangium sp. NPDC005555 TaxID=3154889 RepID=UPI0033A8E100
MDPTMPSLDLVRSVTDEHVLRALMRHRQLTRAELATEIGISKPTAGESVRRLTERGLVADTGERTRGGRGRGRVGSYYALSPAVGVALAVTIAPEGVVAEYVDAYGDTVARGTAPIDRPARPEQVSAALLAALPASPRPRLAVVGAADPVDRATGRLVQLPDAPFLVGSLDPVAVLAPAVGGPVTVDNDVNWAALAERDAAGRLTDFAYLYLGEGLGCAIVGDGSVRRGHHGLAGELAHLLTTGPAGRATHFIDVFGALELRRSGSTAIDVDRLLSRCAADPAVRSTIGTAVAGVIAAVVALADPQEIVLGGTWGPALAGAIRTAIAASPRGVPVHPATVTADPVLTGVRAEALSLLRTAIADGRLDDPRPATAG